MSSNVTIDGVVVGVHAGKVQASSDNLSRVSSIDVNAQWAASRAPKGKPGHVRVFYPAKVSADPHVRNKGAS